MSRTPESFSDAAVPGLGIALRSEDLLDVLRAKLPECRAELELVEGRAVDVQYTPGEGAQVLWKLRMRDAETGRTVRQNLAVRAFRADQALPADPVELIARYSGLRAQKTMRYSMPLATPWLSLPGAMVTVQAYPLDPLMPGLLDVTHPGIMKQSLQRLWRSRGVHVRRVDVDTLSYTPGARAALKYDILSEDSRTQIPELRHLVGKIDARREPARLFAGHWAVWRSTRGRVSVAPPVGYLAVSRLSLQEFLTGRRLSDLTTAGELTGRARRAARDIARVHALNLPVIKQRSLEKEVAGLDRWTQVLAQVRPAQAQRLQRIRERLVSELSRRMEVKATVHADFHLANILVDKGVVMLIDWDQVAHGDPMIDVGRFLASLRVASLRLEGKPDALAGVEDGFIEAYLRETGDDEPRARLFEAASLVTAAAAPFRLQREGWQEYADVMIDEVEHALQQSASGSGFAAAKPDERRQIPFGDRERWAKDRAYSQALLVPGVQAAYGRDVEITRCRPRTVAGASILRARWRLNGFRGNEPWKQVLEGYGDADSSGRNLLKRMAMMHAAVQRDSLTLGIPRPVARLAPLSMIVFERTRGPRLNELLEKDRDAKLASRLGVALAAFQRVDIDLAKERSVDRPLHGVKRALSRQASWNAEDVRTARELFAYLQSEWRGMSRDMVPTIWPMRLRSVRVDGETMIASSFSDLVMAHPHSSAGALLCDLRAIAVGDGAPRPWDAFRSAYLAASGTSAHELACWEALMILRRSSATGDSSGLAVATQILSSGAGTASRSEFLLQSNGDSHSAAAKDQRETARR